MNTRIYDKTDKGREEIATRKHQLQSRLRTLLLLIDGQQTLGNLLRNTAVLGMTAELVTQLESDGFIAIVAGSDPVAAAPRKKPVLRRTMNGTRALSTGDGATA